MEAGSFRLSSINTCPFPIGGDTYRGCVHGCLYCFERQLNNQHLRKVVTVAPRDYRGLFGSLFTEEIVKEFAVQRRIPVQLGICADPFPHIEEKEQCTLKMLRLMRKSGVSALITTKAPNRITDAHVEEILATKYSMVKVSFSTLDDAVAAKMEAGAPLPSVRIAAMRELRSKGVDVCARIDPYIHTFEYDYSKLVGAAQAILMEVIRYAVPWRSSWPFEFWEIVFPGSKIPEGSRKKHSAAYEWAVKREKEFFNMLLSPGMPYYSDVYHWVNSDPAILRKYYIKEKTKIKALGFRFGICSEGSAIHNIDLEDAPYGCCVGSSNRPYDETALIPQWHKDQWAGYKCRLLEESPNSLTVNRMCTANDTDLTPLCLSKD